MNIRFVKSVCRRVVTVLVLTIVSFLAGCMRWDYDLDGEEITLASDGLFIVNEGNFQYGNASLTFYDPTTETVTPDVFIRANGMKLGDVAQSMSVFGGRGWIVVNNSHVIFAIDLETGRETGRIENLTSPRYIHFVSPEKAYVSQLWDNRITIVNPSTYAVTGYIEIPGMTMQTGSTEQMVGYGRDVFCNCWSYQNSIIRIDTATDRVTGRLTVGLQPRWMAKDSSDNLWVLTDGGYEGSPTGNEAPALYCVDPESFSVTRVFRFDLDDTPSGLCTDPSGKRLYWINDGVWTMSTDAVKMPDKPLIEGRRTRYYALTVSPYDGDIYIADAIDYQQPGIVYRYSPDGEPLDSFYAGVTPGAFCWK